jgi:hypothetical protein
MKKTYSQDDFRGYVDELSVLDIKDMLDYTLQTTEERMELINKILSNPKVINFFETVTKQKFDNRTNMSAFKIVISNSNDLCENTNINRLLEQMANYLIYAPDAQKLYKKTEYRFYDEITFNNKINRELSLDAGNGSDYFKLNKDQKNLSGFSEIQNNDDRINFLLIKPNYLLSKKDTITKQDIIRDETGILAAYDDAIKSLLVLRNKIVRAPEDVKNILSIPQMQIIMNSKNIDLDKINTKKLATRARMFIDRTIGYMRADLYVAKAQLFGTIKLKGADFNSTNSNLLNCNYNDVKTVKALMLIRKHPITSDLGLLTYDIDNYINELELSYKFNKIIEMQRLGYDMVETARSIGCLKQYVFGYNKTIAKKIIKLNQQKWIDYVYLNKVKGRYKKCGRCGEVKLVQYFTSHNETKDGLRPECNFCRGIRNKQLKQNKK